ncbi:MAG TPA: class I SAM-dependent methyltransferase [Streptosporangiaceae bacterium]|nr:class I SAM-dependent methyltransferase [Streptosporangiaceae bacterium]
MAEREASARDRLKVTFESVAEHYHAARPDYPGELFDDLVAEAGLQPGARLLEVGAGTGKATIPLAERGFEITALELGPQLAATARRNLARFGLVNVVQQAFETWQPPEKQRFDLVYSATAWHWIDPSVGYERAWQALRPGGHLAIWAADHVLPAADGDPFFRKIQDVYDEIGERLPPGSRFPEPGSLPTLRAAIEGTGLFAVTLTKEFIWSRRYTAQEYISLLDTFSGHIAMAAWQRDRLYGEIRRRLAARPDGTLIRHWGAVLHVARRLDGSLN